MSSNNKDKTLKAGVVPATDSTLANKMVAAISESGGDYSLIYKDIPYVGRLTAESINYPSGIKEVKMIAVPEMNKKKDLKEDIKAMKKNGFKAQDIALKTNMSTSYVYKLLREDES